MKRALLILLLLPFISAAQTPSFPDSKFNSYLLNNPTINTNDDGEIDSLEAATFDGSLFMLSKKIYNLDGIEQMPNVEYINCKENFIDSILLTNNPGLLFLNCRANSIEKLDIASCTSLEYLECFSNKLAELNVSNNPELANLFCHNNELTSLDISSNSLLTMLECNKNFLTSLDLRNGNNINMDVILVDNPNLKCISVDDSTWATENWTDSKDASAVFSNDCSKIVGISNTETLKPIIRANGKTITIQANPSSGSGRCTAIVFNIMGQKVYNTKLNGTTQIKLKQRGIYVVRVSSENTTFSRKVYLN